MNLQTKAVDEAAHRELRSLYFNREADRIRNAHPIAPAIERALAVYVVHRQVPGDFVYALLRNDLKDAVVRADEFNVINLYNIVIWLTNVVPGRAWGSDVKVLQWLSARTEESNG